MTKLSVRITAMGHVLVGYFGKEARAEWNRRLKTVSAEERERMVEEAEKRLRAVLKVIIHG